MDTVELFTKESPKEQIIHQLKAQMSSGKIPSGSKLLSVRKLAEKFGVSTRIVVDAFDLLESEHLIVREPGRGVFASRSIDHTTTNVCLFAYQARPQRDHYFTNLVRMSQPPFLHKGFSFTIRIIPENQNVTHQHFLQELIKIDKYMDAECLLMNVPFLNKRQIEACMKLNTPVIFIGDFSAGLYPELPYNQIAGDNQWLGKTTIERVIKLESCRELVLYSGSMEHYFNRKFYDGAMNEARRLGVELHLIEFPRGISSFRSEAEQWKIFQEKIKFVMEQGWDKLPAISSGGISNELLAQSFDRHNIDIPLYTGEECKKSFEQFFEAVYQQIKAVVNNPKDYKKIRFRSKITINKLDTGINV